MPDVGTQPPSQLPATPPAAVPASDIPLAALAYSAPIVSRQPGILIAVGVASIVLACLSALTCLLVGLETIGIFVIAMISPQITTTMTPAPLTGAQVTQAVVGVQTAASNRLNAAQAQALSAALQDPNQQFLARQFVAFPCRSATFDPATGAVTIVFRGSGRNGARGASVTIDSTGQTTSTTTASTPPAPNPFAKMKLDPVTVGVAIAEDLASFGLAIYLFVAGILLLRDSPNSRKRHLRFAMVKIVLAVIAGVATCRLAAEFLAGLPTPGGITPTTPIVWSVAIWSLLSVAYPVALLFTMNCAEVRRHYAEAK